MTMVLLHPVGLDAESWQFIGLDQFSDVHPYTMLWHGGRPRPSETLTLDTMAADVLNAFDGPLDIVGLSMGGAVAVAAALQAPNRVRSLLLACSSAGGGDPQVQRDRAAATRAGGMAGMLDVTMSRWFSQAALDQRPVLPGVAYTRQRLLDDDPETFAAGWEALGENNAFDKLHTLTMPTSVVHAREDSSGPLAVREKMAAEFPVARLDVIPGPHMVQLELPDVFTAALARHVEWVDGQLG